MIRPYFLILFLLITLHSHTLPQSFNGEWSVDYVTSDSKDSLNSVGMNVISVAVLAEDSFVALANRGTYDAYYIVAYKDAGINSGRLGTYPYGGDDLQDYQTKWINFFDQEYLYDAYDLASKGNLVYVANNDEVNHSILVFEVKDDSVYSHGQRYKVKENIWAIDIDASGRVYVTKTGDSLNAGSVLILDNPDGTTAWNGTGNVGSVLQEFTLPEIGSPRGITVNDEGTIIYVSNWDENKIYCYVGDPVNGYSLYDGFDFQVDDQIITSDSASNPLVVGPFGLQLMTSNNLLFVAHDANFTGGSVYGYSYGRIYIANPNTGEVLDTIDAAEWNFSIENQYQNHNAENKASGYTSNYSVDFDENNNLYTQSWFGWTVDKWIYSGDLPTIDVTITNIEVLDNAIPNSIKLQQNYPNPFNPSTTIEFQVNSPDDVQLSIFNINGELVTRLINKSKLSAGSYKITFDASNLSSGNYFYKLRVGDKILTKKMTLLK